MRAQFSNSMPLMVISGEGTTGEKEQLQMVPRKRQLLDSDEEQEEDEGRNKGRESDRDLLFLLTSSTLPFNPEDQCYCPSFPITYLDSLSLLTPFIPIAPESRAPGIQKKKRFQIEDEDEND